MQPVVIVVSDFVEPEYVDLPAHQLRKVSGWSRTHKCVCVHLADGVELMLGRRQTTQLLQLLGLTKGELHTEEDQRHIYALLDQHKRKLIFRCDPRPLAPNRFAVRGVFTQKYTDVTFTQIFEIVEKILGYHDLSIHATETCEGEGQIYRTYLFTDRVHLAAIGEACRKGLIVKSSRVALSSIMLMPYWARGKRRSAMVAEQAFVVKFRHDKNIRSLQQEINYEIERALVSMEVIAPQIAALQHTQVPLTTVVDGLLAMRFSQRFMSDFLDRLGDATTPSLWEVFDAFTYVVSHSNWKAHRRIVVLRQVWTLLKHLGRGDRKDGKPPR